MLITLKESEYSFSKDCVGKKVIADYHPDTGLYYVRASELARVGVRKFVLSLNMDTRYIFISSEVERVEPKFQNCSDSNSGKGWEGFYEQKPIKKSKFRNH